MGTCAGLRVLLHPRAAVGIGVGVVGFGLAVLLHRQAKRSANRKFTEGGQKQGRLRAPVRRQPQGKGGHRQPDQRFQPDPLPIRPQGVLFQHGLLAALSTHPSAGIQTKGGFSHA